MTCLNALLADADVKLSQLFSFRALKNRTIAWCCGGSQSHSISCLIIFFFESRTTKGSTEKGKEKSNIYRKGRILATKLRKYQPRNFFPADAYEVDFERRTPKMQKLFVRRVENRQLKTENGWKYEKSENWKLMKIWKFENLKTDENMNISSEKKLLNYLMFELSCCRKTWIRFSRSEKLGVVVQSECKGGWHAGVKKLARVPTWCLTRIPKYRKNTDGNEPVYQ